METKPLANSVQERYCATYFATKDDSDLYVFITADNQHVATMTDCMQPTTIAQQDNLEMDSDLGLQNQNL